MGPHISPLKNVLSASVLVGTSIVFASAPRLGCYSIEDPGEKLK